MAVVAGTPLAGREGEDTRLRGAARDPENAAHGAQSSGTAGERRLSRGALPGAPRHGGSPVPRARWSKPARVHRMRRRGSQLRVLPPSRAVRPALETIDRGTTGCGRLNRIGRRIPVEIVYFRPPGGIGADVVRLFEALGLFREPLAGLEPQLAHVEGALEEVALDRRASLSGERFEVLVSEAHAARTRIREAAYQQLHRDPYRSEMAAGILARVPKELDALNEEVVVTACMAWGSRLSARAAGFSRIQLGSGALVDGLPGVPGGSSYVGSFDREEALEEEGLDFFASGHPLVEGILRPLRGERPGPGRAVRGRHRPGAGRGTCRRLQGRVVFEAVVIDSAGRARPDWAAAFRQRSVRGRPVTDEPIRGPGLEGHGSPTRSAARTGAPSALCARGHRRAAGR